MRAVLHLQKCLAVRPEFFLEGLKGRPVNLPRRGVVMVGEPAKLMQHCRAHSRVGVRCKADEKRCQEGIAGLLPFT